ncbi:unnamed protein product, partial [Urochloa humidicola]
TLSSSADGGSFALARLRLLTPEFLIPNRQRRNLLLLAEESNHQIQEISGATQIPSTMKIAWGKNAKMKRRPVVVSTKPGLPFGVESDTDEAEKEEAAGANTNCAGTKPLDTAESLQRQGDKLAEEGNYHEALSRWEAALTLAPDNAILHEQKAQVLLEVGDAWHALTAATRATELEPSWPEAWVTLGRAQLNFGEPDSAILSFDKALAIKPDHRDAKADRETAARLVKKRGQLHSSGLSANKRRFTVGENTDKGAEGEGKADETAVLSGYPAT